MEALAIIERLDELKHRRVRFLARVEPLVMHQLILQGAEEAFDDGIVIAIAFATHTAHQPMLSQQALVGEARV